MTLLEEYYNQNIWRDWDRYLEKLPLKPDQVVFDLGCSVGAVSKLLAQKVDSVTGFDGDVLLLDTASESCPSNCAFVLGDILTLDPEKYGSCDGIWMSFTLAYMQEPGSFISKWARCLKPGGWFALSDIDSLFSCHLPCDSELYQKVVTFEKLSEANNSYDFRIGRKIRDLMAQNGLEICFEDQDWYDRELNFKGRAAPEIAQSWEARLSRMLMLKSYFGAEYPEFCHSFIKTISDERHESSGGVRYLVGVKKA